MTGNEITRVTPILADKYLFVEIETRAGFIGTGEAGAWSHIEATAAVLEKFSAYLLGRDAETIERHWQVLRRFGSYSGSICMAAVSAVDMALWDLKGQRLGEPIYGLLGGGYRNKVRVYGQARGNCLGQLVQRCLTLKSAGFTAIGHINPFLDEDLSSIQNGSHAMQIEKAVMALESIRDTIGLDVDLCVEIHRRLRPADAIVLGQRIAHLSPLFYEDPIRPGSISAMAHVQSNITIPVATGERLYSLEQFYELMAAGAARYIRPCLSLCGGFTGAKKIAALAEAFDVEVIPHNTYSPIATAASVHFAAVIPNLLILEFPTARFTDDFASTELVARELTTSAPTQQDGYVVIGEQPGLGTKLVDNIVRQFPIRPIPVAMRAHHDGSPIEH